MVYLDNREKLAARVLKGERWPPLPFELGWNAPNSGPTSQVANP